MKKINEQMGTKGHYFKFDIADYVGKDSMELNLIRGLSRKYTNKKELIKDRIYKFLVEKGAILQVQEKCNLIPTVGRAVFTERIAGGSTYTGEVDWGALGSGSTAFTNASTQLNTEVYRMQASAQAYSDNIAYIDWFVASGDVADQTFEEFGAFIDGSASADSGQAFSLLITGGWIKSGSMFISAQYTLN